MNDQIAKKNLIAILEKEVERFSYHGIFFDGKLVCMTKSRVYLQPGRATSELVSQNMYSIIKGIQYDPNMQYTAARKAEKQAAKDAVNELIKEGRLEIKAV